MNPAWLHPHCALIWRHVYDCAAACVDDVSIATTIELAVADRTAYICRNRRDRSIISSDCIKYLRAIIKAIFGREWVQYKNCQIDPVPMNKSTDVRVKRKSIIIVHYWLALLLHKEDAVYQLMEEQDYENEDSVLLVDYSHQIVMLHVRGT